MTDKAITRAAARGCPRILMFGRWWPLERGATYRIAYNRREPGKSRVEQAIAPTLQPIEAWRRRVQPSR